MSLRKKQSLFAQLVPRLIDKMYEEGYEVTLGETWRHPVTASYMQRTGKGVSNSFHTMKLAIDINLFKDGKYLTSTEDHRPFGEYWKSLHHDCTWGGDFKRKDGNHYSMFEH